MAAVDSDIIDALEENMLDKSQIHKDSAMTPSFLEAAGETQLTGGETNQGGVVPVETDVKVKQTQREIRFLKWYTLSTVLIAVCLVGTSIPLLLEIKNYDKIRAPLAEVGSTAAFSLALPYMILISIFLFCLAAVLSYYGYKHQKISFVYLAMTFSVVAGAACLAIGMSTFGTLDLLLEQFESNPIETEFGALETDVTDFTSAIFNECCLPLYDNLNYTFGNTGQLLGVNGEALDDTQREVPPCGETLIETCPTDEENRMFPELVTNVINQGDFGASILCTCFSDRGIYEELVDILRRDDLCNAYRNLVIDDGADEKIPVLGQSMNDLFGLLADFQRAEFQERLPIGKMAIVAKPLPAEQLYNEPSEDIGFGCGIGYAKAVSFQMFLYISEKTRVLLVSANVIGGFAIFSTFCVNLLWALEYLCGFEDEEFDEYEEHTKKKSLTRRKKKSLSQIGTGRIRRLFSKAQTASEY